LAGNFATFFYGITLVNAEVINSDMVNAGGLQMMFSDL
jgi:hypothetical protein